VNYLPGLASNLDPPDLCILSNWDYRREPLGPSWLWFLEYDSKSLGSKRKQVNWLSSKLKTFVHQTFNSERQYKETGGKL
jgi:hypothetical protein